MSTTDTSSVLGAGADQSPVTGSVPELIESLRWALRRISTSNLGEGEHFTRAQAVADAASQNQIVVVPDCDADIVKDCNVLAVRWRSVLTHMRSRNELPAWLLKNMPWIGTQRDHSAFKELEYREVGLDRDAEQWVPVLLIPDEPVDGMATCHDEPLPGVFSYGEAYSAAVSALGSRPDAVGAAARPQAWRFAS